MHQRFLKKLCLSLTIHASKTKKVLVSTKILSFQTTVLDNCLIILSRIEFLQALTWQIDSYIAGYTHH